MKYPKAVDYSKPISTQLFDDEGEWIRFFIKNTTEADQNTVLGEYFRKLMSSTDQVALVKSMWTKV